MAAAAYEEGPPPRRAGAGWRENFLNRRRRSGAEAQDGEDSEALEREPRESRVRSVSRPRAASRPRPTAADSGEAAAEAFNQKAVLDQDRALIEQLTQRQPRRERSAVRKPPPPPKIAPHRSSAAGASPKMAAAVSATAGSGPGVGPTLLESFPPPEKPIANADSAAALDNALPQGTPVPEGAASAERALGAEPPPGPSNPPATTDPSAEPALPAARPALPATRTADSAAVGAGAVAASSAISSYAVPVPVVPRSGQLFTASDIDNLMNRLGGPPAGAEGDSPSGGGNTPNVAVASGPPVVDPVECKQTFGDISKEFFQDHRMELPHPPIEEGVGSVEVVEPARAAEERFEKPFVVPSRKALKEQISAIDSWLEDDFVAREKLQAGAAPAGISAGLLGAPAAARASAAPPADLHAVAAGAADAPGMGAAEAEIFRKLEHAKKQKALGERPSPVLLKDLATQAKPLLPGLGLEALVTLLRLFTSARYEDHDLYLRILGEIPVQVRGISPASLTTCVRVLRRLRLPEETYLELFSMEAMNMIRAKRRPQARAPRRPPAPAPGRSVGPPAQGAQGPAAPPAPAGGGPPLTPVPPAPTPPQDAPAPFSAAELVQLGNALTQLGAKHAGRFMEIFQEQLALAIPRMTREECELVSPTLAFSQLMHDPLRRAFLERCAAVDAGHALPEFAAGAAPDIAEYQRESDHRRRRVKHFRNIFVVEASVRKETWSFFTSLPADVRTYLDRVHAASGALQHEGPSVLAQQIADVLGQLGVVCDLARTAGPLSLHVVAKATNPRAEAGEVVYECNDVQAFYAVRQDDKGSGPQPTAQTRFRHKLLGRLGVQLTHINGYEWQQMSEAQRVNYMVKLQSLQ